MAVEAQQKLEREKTEKLAAEKKLLEANKQGSKPSQVVNLINHLVIQLSNNFMVVDCKKISIVG